jgi:CheY-like chemotaxis protein
MPYNVAFVPKMVLRAAFIWNSARAGLICCFNQGLFMSYSNILLIDDDHDDQEIFLTALEHITDKVHCATIDSARDALRQLQAQQIHTDLIFLDLNMPVMNGQQFLMELKKSEALKHLPVIIFSTSSHAQTIREAKELGALDFITKPDKFDELKRVLQSIIG